jgi:hypothetical protein
MSVTQLTIQVTQRVVWQILTNKKHQHINHPLYWGNTTNSNIAKPYIAYRLALGFLLQSMRQKYAAHDLTYTHTGAEFRRL